MGCVGLGFGGSLGGGVRSIWVCGYGFRGYNLCWYPMTWEEEEEELSWFFFFWYQNRLGKKKNKNSAKFFFFFFFVYVYGFWFVCLFVLFCFLFFFSYQSLFAIKVCLRLVVGADVNINRVLNN